MLALALFCMKRDADAAAPPKDTPIGNQASATYDDASGTSRTATSNVAITIVQQVAAVTLTSDNTKTAGPGAQVSFPHTVSNNGNGTDSFTFTVTQSAGDNFDLSNVKIYADANGDGVPDNSIDLTSSGTGPIPSGQVFRFVVVGNIPGTAVAGNTGALTVKVTSAFDNTVASSNNTDTANVTANAAINVTKSFSVTSGAAGSGPVTVTLTYVNSGNNNATNLTLTDIIPTGMTYVAGSGRWSVTGSTTLTDADATDLQGTAPNQIVYDYGVSLAGRVTAVVKKVAPGQSGTLSFNVNISASAPPGTIPNTAVYSYDPGTGTPTTDANSNTAQFNVLQAANVTLTGQTIASANQGATVNFTNIVENTGTGTDTFDITYSNTSFPSGSAIALFKSDGATPLSDSSGNGIPDTGPLASGASYSVVVRVTLPTSASGGGPYALNKTATSVFDNTKSSTGTDTLTTIAANVVSVVNNSPTGTGGGVGSSPITTHTNIPASTTNFVLYVKNISGSADTYDLKASTDSSFATVTLPSGWVVVFKDSGGAVITSTGVITPGSSQYVKAEVTIPAGYSPGLVDLYFQAKSPTSGAHSEKHDAIRVATVRDISVTPNNSGQIFPGGTVIYSHLVANNGNVPEGDGTVSTITLGVANSQSGWSSVTYYDANSNGTLDATDPIVTSLNSIGGLAKVGAPGSSVRIFVKVFSPVGAPAGSADTATLTATTTLGTYTTAAPAAVSANDLTTVISGDLVMVKEQALDADGNGTPEGSYATTPITTGAKPGSCIRYKITVTNRGTADATSVVVNDTTPSFTTYHTGDATTSATGKACWTLDGATFSLTGVTAPANGAAGTITVTVGTLTPGQSAILYFGVKINQ